MFMYVLCELNPNSSSPVMNDGTSKPRVISLYTELTSLVKSEQEKVVVILLEQKPQQHLLEMLAKL